MSNQFLPGVIQIPSTLLITGITRSSPMVVSFSVPSTGANTYIPGQVVRLNIPQPYKMFQANGLMGKIITIGVSTMALNIDSSNFDAFVVPSGNVSEPASLAPAGSRNLEFNNTTDFVGFQSLDNIGN